MMLLQYQKELLISNLTEQHKTTLTHDDFTLDV